MALSRSMLKEMGISEENIGTIIEAHAETVNGLKEQIKTYKADAEKLPDVQRQLDAYKNDKDWKAEYTREHSEFEEYKTKIQQKETEGAIRNAYKQLLVEQNVGEAFVDLILNGTDFSKMSLDDKGKLKNVDTLVESIKSQYKNFISQKETKGADVETPPGGGGAKMTKEEILKIKDTSERQKAIAENHELFGI